MATTTPNKFLAITSNPLNINAGWQIHVLDYKDMKTRVAIIADFNSFSFTQQLNDPGTGSITFDTDSLWWNTILNNGLSARTLLNHEYVFEARENGVARFSWLAQTVENELIGDDGAHVTTISGPGIAQVMTWACIQRPGWPKTPPLTIASSTGHKFPRDVSYNDNSPALLWRFPTKWPSMQMWFTVFKAAQRRGVCKFVTPMFSATTDSAGVKWQYVKTVQNIVDNHGYQPEEPGENLLEFLNDCTGQDYSKWFGQRLEWMMYPGFKLDVRKTIGTDRSDTVRFYTGMLPSSSRTRDRENIFNRITAVDVDGNESIRTNAGSVASWNLREQRNETNKNITDKTLRDQLADRYLLQSGTEKSQWTMKIDYGEDGRTPYHNFYVGDKIGISDTGSGPSDIQSYRVMAISVNFDGDSSFVDVELTLQSIIDARDIELQKKITQITTQPSNFDISQLKNVNIPTTPTVSSTMTFDPKTKKWVATPSSTLSNRVFIGSADPATTQANEVKTGDFWINLGGFGGY